MTLPNSITIIGGGAFWGCSSLTSIDIPNSVTSIGRNGFGNSGLVSVIIPQNVVYIGDYAFAWCVGLMNVTNYAITPQIISDNVFSGAHSSLKIYVPCGTLQTFVNADGWKNYAEQIQYTPVKIIGAVLDDQTGYVNVPNLTICDGKGEITAIPNSGYQFVQWSDGNTDNPRTIILTQDTAFTAQFDLIHYPVIFLDYNGAVLSEQSVAHNSAATAPEVAEREGYRFIGWSADIEHITASTFVIALYEKKGINITYKDTEGEIIASEEVDIHIPDAPIIEGSTFAGWLTEAANNSEGIILRATYTIDHPTINEDVTIEPGSTTAGVSFPYISGTLTYVLVVRDLFGFVVCKIMFNATGHLLGVAFAPGHKSAQQAQTEGFRFTVEGLTPSTTYEYEFVAHDETDAVIEKLAGSFTTIEDVTTEMANPNQSNAPQKILYEGIMYILKNGEKYNAQGARVE